jgi:hypothetical protein
MALEAGGAVDWVGRDEENPELDEKEEEEEEEEEEGKPVLPAAVGLADMSMLNLETFARIAPSHTGISAVSSVISSHTGLLSGVPSKRFLKRKWYAPGRGKCWRTSRRVGGLRAEGGRWKMLGWVASSPSLGM